MRRMQHTHSEPCLYFRPNEIALASRQVTSAYCGSRYSVVINILYFIVQSHIILISNSRVSKHSEHKAYLKSDAGDYVLFENSGGLK